MYIALYVTDNSVPVNIMIVEHVNFHPKYQTPADSICWYIAMCHMLYNHHLLSRSRGSII